MSYYQTNYSPSDTISLPFEHLSEAITFKIEFHPLRDLTLVIASDRMNHPYKSQVSRMKFLLESELANARSNDSEKCFKVGTNYIFST